MGDVGRDPDPRRPLVDRVLQLAAAVVSVDTPAQRVAGSQVSESGQPHIVARIGEAQRRSAHFRKRLARGKAELRV